MLPSVTSQMPDYDVTNDVTNARPMTSPMTSLPTDLFNIVVGHGARFVVSDTELVGDPVRFLREHLLLRLALHPGVVLVAHCSAPYSHSQRADMPLYRAHIHC